MPKRKMIGTDSDYEKIRLHINDWFGLLIPLKDLKKAMEKEEQGDPDFWKDEFKHKSYTDTMVREMIASAITEHFIGLEWPINGDTDEVKEKFYTKLAKVVKTRKWEWCGRD